MCCSRLSMVLQRPCNNVSCRFVSQHCSLELSSSNLSFFDFPIVFYSIDGSARQHTAPYNRIQDTEMYDITEQWVLMLSLFRDVTSGNTHQMSQNFNERGYNLQKDKMNTIRILKFQLSKSQVTSFFSIWSILKVQIMFMSKTKLLHLAMYSF